MPRPTVTREPARAEPEPVDVVRDDSRRVTSAPDALAVEEPLEIRLDGWRWLVTMRTPGDDADLIVGLLASEGVIASADEVDAILFSRHPEEPDTANLADVHLRRPLAELQARLARNQIVASSSCGLCGASVIDAVLKECTPVQPGPEVSAATIARLPATLAEAQPMFRATGGVHAAALFDATGALLVAREDIGRHNATDKALGWRLREGDAAHAPAVVLLVSGRASFEIVQKAVVARVPIVAAVSAPSSLAVALARRAGMTLAGFVRGGEVKLYSGAERVRTSDHAAHSTAARTRA
jgi:FdhD protein